MCSILAAWEPQLYTAPDWFTPPTLALQMVVLNRVRPISTHPFQKESSRGSLARALWLSTKKRESRFSVTTSTAQPTTTPPPHSPHPAPSSTIQHQHQHASPSPFCCKSTSHYPSKGTVCCSTVHRPSSYNTNMEASAVCDSLSPDTAIAQLPPHDGTAADSSHTAVEGLPGGAATAPLSSAAGGLFGAAAAAPNLRQIFADDRSGAPTQAAQPR